MRTDSARASVSSSHKWNSEPSVRLSTLDHKVLWWLLRYPLQRVEDLVLALAVSTNTMYRRLNQLVEKGLVEYVTPSLGIRSTCRLFYLTHHGILIVATREQDDPGELSQRFYANETGLLRLLPRVSSLVLVQNLLNGLCKHAPLMLAHRRGYRADIAWHWVRDYQQSFRVKEQVVSCHVDAALLFQRRIAGNGREDAQRVEYFSALLLIDPGFDGPDDQQLITQRLETLFSLREYIERRSGGLPFSPVLVLTSTDHQRERWQHLVVKVARKLHVAPLNGAIVTVSNQRPYEQSWTLAWQKLASPVACRLRDIFVLQNRDALPDGLLMRRRMPTEKWSAQGMPDASVPSPRTPRLVRGDYTGRATVLTSLSVAANEKEEREMVALLRLCLSERHLDILALLYAYPLLTTQELATFLGLQSESVTRYLFDLRRYGCIDEDVTAQRWLASTGGLRLLAATYNCSLQHVLETMAEEGDTRRVQRGLRLLQKRLSHTIALYRFFSAIQRGGQQSNAEQSLLWWEIGTYSHHHYLDHGQWQHLRPDALFASQVRGTRFLAWLEWQNTSISTQHFVSKIQTYGNYARKREWVAAGLNALPMLCIVVPDNSQLQRVVRIIAQELVRSELMVRITTARQIDKHGPLAKIWLQAMPALTADQSQEKILPVGLFDPGQQAIEHRH